MTVFLENVFPYYSPHKYFVKITAQSVHIVQTLSYIFYLFQNACSMKMNLPVLSYQLPKVEY